MEQTLTAYFLRCMRKSLVCFMTLICTITFGSFFIVTVKEAFAANLRTLTVIDDKFVRASDVFEGLTYNADKVLGPAPLPGRDMVLNARTLLRIAMALDLPWRPETSGEQVIIRRAATIIEPELITTELTAALKERGAGEKFTVKFSQPASSLVLPPNEVPSVEISQLTYDPSRGSFQAEIVAPSNKRPVKRKFVQGKIERIVNVPVLSRTIQSGSLISASDVQWVEMPAYQVQHDLILSTDDLVGLTPRRIAMAGEPLRQSEIVEPLMVERGETVNLSYKSGTIHLTAEAKALQNGAKGDLIRVVNLTSNRTVDALVTAERTVIVK